MDMMKIKDDDDVNVFFARCFERANIHKLSRDAKITRTALYKLRDTNTSPRLETLMRFCAALNVELCVIFPENQPTDSQQ